MEALNITISISTRLIELLMNSVNSFQGLVDSFGENIHLREQSSQHRQQQTSEQCHPQQQNANNMKSFGESMPQNEEHPKSNAPGDEVRSQGQQDTDENAVLRAELFRYREQNAELIKNFEQLNAEMKQKKINSFEALAEQDKEALKVLIELARQTPPMVMQGNNIGVFGLTSRGKSTLLNSILGQKVAETGVGETTTKITSYPMQNFILWDMPGRNDEINFMTMEYISFLKGLSTRLILIEATVKENSSIMKLLDAIGSNYTIVFNKFDKIDEEERSGICPQIDSEIKSLGLKRLDRIFFVSAKYPTMFPDWQTMINYIQNPRN